MNALDLVLASTAFTDVQLALPDLLSLRAVSQEAAATLLRSPDSLWAHAAAATFPAGHPVLLAGAKGGALKAVQRWLTVQAHIRTGLVKTQQSSLEESAAGLVQVHALVQAVRGIASQHPNYLALAQDRSRAALYMGHNQLCLVSTQAALQVAALGLPPGHQPHSLSWAPDGQTLAVLSQTSAPSPAQASTFEHRVVVSFHAANGASMGAVTLAAPVRMPSAASLQWRPDGSCVAFASAFQVHVCSPGLPTARSIKLSHNQRAKHSACQVPSFAFSPCGRQLAVCGPHQELFIAIHSLDSLVQLQRLPLSSPAYVDHMTWGLHGLGIEALQDVRLVDDKGCRQVAPSVSRGREAWAWSPCGVYLAHVHVSAANATLLQVMKAADGSLLLQACSAAPEGLPADAQLQSLQLAWSAFGDQLLTASTYCGPSWRSRSVVHTTAFDFA